MKDRQEKQECSLRTVQAALSIVMVFGLWGCQGGYSRHLPPPDIVVVGKKWSKPAPIRRSAQLRGSQEEPKGWAPQRHLEGKRRWEGILIHHSVLEQGPASYIDNLHKARGWDGLGYHFVINNGAGARDGVTEVGFRWHEQREGAHCRVHSSDNNYWNEHTIGICLIGNFERRRPSEAQYRSLVELVRYLQRRYRIPTDRIRGHKDVSVTLCPGRQFSMTELKRRL